MSEDPTPGTWLKLRGVSKAANPAGFTRRVQVIRYDGDYVIVRGRDGLQESLHVDGLRRYKEEAES